jgi:hypothetical protein
MTMGRPHGRSRLGMPPAKKAAAPTKTTTQATITLKPSPPSCVQL